MGNSINISDVSIIKLPFKDLKVIQGNLKTLPDENYQKLKNELLTVGFKIPFFIWDNNGVRELLDGTQRFHTLTRMASEGIDVDKKYPCCILDVATRKEAGEMILAISSQYGKMTLDSMLDFNTEFEIDNDEAKDRFDFDGFDIEIVDQDEVDRLEEIEDDVPELKKETIIKRGDIIELGKHRLMCGDSTMIDDVEKLMDGQKADMVFTDPPYNTGMTSEKQAGTGSLWKGNKKKNEKARLSHMFDDSFTDEEWVDFIKSFCGVYFSQMKDNTGAYICLDWRRNHELVPVLKEYFKLSNVIVWDKVVHGLGSDYKYTYELINVCKKGKPELDTHQGEREYSDVWHIQRKMGKNKEHATAKPVELVERCLRHASKPNSLVIDYFQGSGTTLIACEKTNRKCFGMELDEHYCDVIISRYCKYVGKYDIILNGKSYDWSNEA